MPVQEPLCVILFIVVVAPVSCRLAPEFRLPVGRDFLGMIYVKISPWERPRTPDAVRDIDPRAIRRFSVPTREAIRLVDNSLDWEEYASNRADCVILSWFMQYIRYRLPNGRANIRRVPNASHCGANGAEYLLEKRISRADLTRTVRVGFGDRVGG